MFIVTTNPTFRHEVKVHVPVDGGFDVQSVQATFRVQPADRESEHDLGTTEGSTALLRDIVTELSDLVDSAKQPVAWNDHLRDQLFRLPYIRAALVKAYYGAIQKATEGN